MADPLDADSAHQTRNILGASDQEIFKYILSFLAGKELACLSAVGLKPSKNKILQKYAQQQFTKHHPNLSTVPNKKELLISGYIRLFEDSQLSHINIVRGIKQIIHDFHRDPRLFSLLQKHTAYSDMPSTSYPYMLHLECCPVIQDINTRFRNTITTRTNYNMINHIQYFIEKLFGYGNIVLLINSFKYLKRNGIMVARKQFIKGLRYYGDKIGSEFRDQPDLDKEFVVGDYECIFRMETKLYLYQYYKALLMHFIGSHYYRLIHHEMIECCQAGLIDQAVGFRKLGAVLIPNLQLAMKWTNDVFEDYGSICFQSVIWDDLKDPNQVTRAQYITPELLQRKLDSMVAVYSIGEINEDEKLKELKYITENKHYSVKQMANFGIKLLELDAVSNYIKDDLMRWCFANCWFHYSSMT